MPPTQIAALVVVPEERAVSLARLIAFRDAATDRRCKWGFHLRIPICG